jgi:ubiquinone biosynthesis protein COQ4
MIQLHSSSRFRPLDALRALRALSRDPDDTGQVFKIISALSGDTQGRMLRRLQKSETGRRLLDERRPLLPVLSDRARLGALPENSLGRAYLSFCERAGITAEGLVAASEEGDFSDRSADELFLAGRMRDAHDLWHVVAGYQTDLIGEACVLAMTVAQAKNPGIALIVVLAYLRPRAEHGRVRALLRQAFARGLRAAWLPGVDWEALLPRPLDAVRRELGLSDPPDYEPLWPHQVFAHKQPRAAQLAS